MFIKEDILEYGDKKGQKYNYYSNKYANEDEMAWFVAQGFTRKDVEEDGKSKVLFSKTK